DHRIVEDPGILSLQLPGHEERRPVDVGSELGKRQVVEYAHAEERRHGDGRIGPVDREPLLKCLGIRDKLALATLRETGTLALLHRAILAIELAAGLGPV